MNPLSYSLCLAVLLSGCAALTEPSSETELANIACDKQTDTICRYINSPVRLSAATRELPGRPYAFRETVENLDFIDSRGRNWRADRGTLTDGASIPPAFIKMMGQPSSPTFVNAAAIHDAYCGVGNEEGPKYQTRAWREVHRAFYEALRVAGTPDVKAKLMYSAVMFGGPRWGSGPGLVNREINRRNAGHQRNELPGRADLAGIPTARIQAAFSDVLKYVEGNNPQLSELDAYLWWKEKELRQNPLHDPDLKDQDDRGHYEEETEETDESGNDGSGTDDLTDGVTIPSTDDGVTSTPIPDDV